MWFIFVVFLSLDTVFYSSSGMKYNIINCMMILLFPAVQLFRYHSLLWLLQVSPGWGQSSPQEAGAAGHGSTPETLAVQTPWQPIPHQDREGSASSGFTYDTSSGETEEWSDVLNFVSCSVTCGICAGFQLVRKRPAEAEEYSETAGPELGPEDQTL